MWEKWSSLANHVANIHTGHGKEFPACAHGPIEICGRKKKWLKPGVVINKKDYSCILFLE